MEYKNECKGIATFHIKTFKTNPQVVSRDELPTKTEAGQDFVQVHPDTEKTTVGAEVLWWRRHKNWDSDLIAERGEAKGRMTASFGSVWSMMMIVVAMTIVVVKTGVE